MGITRIQLDATLDELRLPEMETLLDGRQQKKIAGRDDWAIRTGTFWTGPSAGVEVVELCNGPLSIYVLPTRGMGIWKARYEELTLGWQSAVPHPVHPHYVNLHSRNGLGWLDGFNELLCRCGLASNGPPGHDDGAKSPLESDLTLHGKIANLPAHDVELFVDDETQTIGVTGIVSECSLFGPQLQLRSTISTKVGSDTIDILDEVTNVGPETSEMQLLYHANFGRPFLEEGSQVECAADRVIPRDSQAAEGVRTHTSCLGPTNGFAEQVYYYQLRADTDGQTRALLKNRAGDRAVSLAFNISQLPCFSVWKCTQDERAGYVAGLEPATNYPNFKTFERHHGRVVQLPSGKTYTSALQIQIHDNSESVAACSAQIKSLQGTGEPRLHSHPASPYCPID